MQKEQKKLCKIIFLQGIVLLFFYIFVNNVKEYATASENKHAINDNTKVRIVKLYRLGLENLNTNPEEALLYTKMALPLINKVKDVDGKIAVYKLNHNALKKLSIDKAKDSFQSKNNMSNANESFSINTNSNVKSIFTTTKNQYRKFVFYPF